ncbi:hypothetical protein [Pseudoxanthomonas winnipegensis]|uniref:Uncharacterized protein n=1 Tax=Pseudoxanthomonas winnipegensis TaxID=2480810 RepID=A0A4Q8LC31_9GAMM|nr:hypothetical protein [Pseudoxanthomonas winnipegensis]RZZ83753.1 hypothetical protein EA662_14335 [Pseudoxanthomonas winnipegensis]TAA26418.1 hypothetical protein EA661_15930 [Pseudoxanthomonas winnipegensis]TAA42881.1 hypothetical protein EAT51_04055 [Pseudoxanthomonas winnipegensis]TBV73794.1 hypothetical protein EYC46_14035 [Pseudoxanthomonas winnipegensis]
MRERAYRWRLLRRALFWTLTAIAASVVALFLWAAAPLALTLARGGRGELWFLGEGAMVLAAALAYLVAAALVVARQKARERNG